MSAAIALALACALALAASIWIIVADAKRLRRIIGPATRRHATGSLVELAGLLILANDCLALLCILVQGLPDETVMNWPGSLPIFFTLMGVSVTMAATGRIICLRSFHAMTHETYRAGQPA